VGLNFAATNLVNALIYTGAWDAAANLAKQTIKEGAEYEGAAAGSLYDRLALIHALRGELDAARENFDRAEALLAPADRQDVGIHAAAGAAIKLTEGDHTAVLSGIDQMTDLAATFGWSSEMVRQMWPDAAEAALRSRDVASVAQLEAMLEGVAPGRLSPYLGAQLMRTQARLAAARGATDGIEEGLRDAIERFGAMSYPYWEAMARLDLANCLIDQGRNDDAVMLSDTAAEVFERLGAAPDMDRARRLGSTAVVS
jgi:tetratricopeptide (TPR) repeat protein